MLNILNTFFTKLSFERKSHKYPVPEEKTYFGNSITAINELVNFEYIGTLELNKSIEEKRVGFYSGTLELEDGIKEFIYYRNEYNEGVLTKEQENTFYFINTEYLLNSSEKQILSQRIYSAEGKFIGYSFQSNPEPDLKRDENRFSRGDLVQFFDKGVVSVGIVAANPHPEFLKTKFRNHLICQNVYTILTETDKSFLQECTLLPLTIDIDGLLYLNLHQRLDKFKKGLVR